MAYDALLRNLAVSGEAVRSLPTETREACLMFHGRR